MTTLGVDPGRLVVPLDPVQIPELCPGAPNLQGRCVIHNVAAWDVISIPSYYAYVLGV